jgi:hypothetical protein
MQVWLLNPADHNAISCAHRYRAHVQAVGHDCDLALLSVDDDAFWEAPTEIRPLALGKLPALQQVGSEVLGTEKAALPTILTAVRQLWCSSTYTHGT